MRERDESVRLVNAAPAASVVDFLRDGFARFRFFAWLRAWKRPERQLHVRETLSLGNRGVIAVVAYREQQFLVGCTNTSIALLAKLSDGEEFAAELAEQSRKGE
jgi:flagellar biogenesis protein FliO